MQRRTLLQLMLAPLALLVKPALGKEFPLSTVETKEQGWVFLLDVEKGVIAWRKRVDDRLPHLLGMLERKLYIHVQTDNTGRLVKAQWAELVGSAPERPTLLEAIRFNTVSGATPGVQFYWMSVRSFSEPEIILKRTADGLIHGKVYHTNGQESALNFNPGKTAVHESIESTNIQSKLLRAAGAIPAVSLGSDRKSAS